MSDLKGRKTLEMNDQGQDKGQVKPQVQGNSRAITIVDAPQEVLEVFFKNVESPKDLLSCWNATSAWTNALRSTDFYFKMTLLFLLQYLDRKDLLQCSLVSKSWNGAVDACIQTTEDFGSDYRLKPKQRIVLELKANNMTRFLSTFKSEGAAENTVATNPVAFRRVHVFLRFDSLFPNDSFALESSSLLKCLDYHGHLVQYLHLDFNDSSVALLNKLKLTRSCLGRTPNLRVLRISTPFTASCDRENEQKSVDVQLKAFHEYIAQNSWPSLEHLKVLKFKYPTDCREFSSVADAYALQLLSLQFGFKLMEPLRLRTERFSRLQKIFYFFSDPSSGVQLGDFVQSSQCPLKHLTVGFKKIPDDENYDGLATAVNAASATLETLIFYLCPWTFSRPPNFDISKFERLKLPKLKVLKLDTFGYPSLQFLQTGCPALESLIVTPVLNTWIGCLCDSMSITHKRLLVEHGDIYADLYSQHQLWNELADLQRVDVKYLVFSKNDVEIEKEMVSSQEAKEQHTVYTRDGFDAKQLQLEKDFRRRRLERSKLAVAKAKKFILNRKSY